jgi:hypothetical protein
MRGGERRVSGKALRAAREGASLAARRSNEREG